MINRRAPVSQYQVFLEEVGTKMQMNQDESGDNLLIR